MPVNHQGHQVGRRRRPGHCSLFIGLILAVNQWPGSTIARPVERLPTPDFEHFGTYLTRLEHSRNPEARAILRQIASGPADLARERAAARKEHLPLELKALQGPMPPDDQNAAPLYRKLAELLKRKPLELPLYAMPSSPRYRYTPQQIANVQQILDRRLDVMDLVHKITLRPRWVPRGPNPARRYSDFGTMRDVERLLKTRSYLLARAGRYSKAIALQSRGFRVSGHAASEPLFVNYLVVVALNGIALVGIKDILRMGGSGVVEEIQRSLQDNPSKLSLKFSLSGEIATCLAEIEPARTQGPGVLAELTDPDITGTRRRLRPQPMNSQQRRFLGHLLDAQEAYLIHRLRAVIKAVGQPPTVRRRAFHFSEREQENPVTILTTILAPIDENALDQRVHAERAVVAAGAAVLAERASTGTMPANLPRAFPDPYSRGSLRYRKEGADGFVVYSVGPDGKFDGGKPGDDERKLQFRPNTAVRNVFFRYPAPVPVPPG